MVQLASQRGQRLVSTGSNRGIYALAATAGGLVVVISFIAVRMYFLRVSDPLPGSARTDELSAYLVLAALVAAVSAALGQHYGRYEDELRRLCLVDDLTGLFNRRHLDLRLTQELDRASRYGFPLSVALIDVDELKRINDSLGHRAGDDALRRVASVLAAHVRSADVAARFGGDEFVLVLPHTSVLEAETLAHRIRRAVGSTSPGDLFRVTVSIGLSGVHASSGAISSPAQLLDAADQALFRAKGEGRDGVDMEPSRRSPVSRISRGEEPRPSVMLRD